MARKKNPSKPAAKKRGHRKAILTVEHVSAAIVRHEGNISRIAKGFGVQRASVQEFIKKNPKLAEILEDAREERLDNAEDSLQEFIQNGEVAALIFYLKTQGRHRGYSEKLQLSGDKESPIQHEHSGAVNAAFTLTPADVVAARQIMAMAGFDVSPDSGSKPVDSEPRQAEKQPEAEAVPAAE